MNFAWRNLPAAGPGLSSRIQNGVWRRGHATGRGRGTQHRAQGVAGLFWLIADIAIRLPIEYLSEMRQDMRYASRALIKSPGFALGCRTTTSSNIGSKRNW